MKKVLIIDDEISIKENLCEILTLKGYIVNCEGSGKDAINRIEQYMPDIIISDIMMPEMNGHEFLKLLREKKEFANTPVIFLSARQDLKDIREGMNLGADDYLTKPFDVKDLLRAVENRLAKVENIQSDVSSRVDELLLALNRTSSHEFNTPLNGIILPAEFMLQSFEKIPKEQMQKLLNAVLQSGFRLKRTLDNFLLSQKLMREKEILQNEYVPSKMLITEDKARSIAEALLPKYAKNLDLRIQVDECSVNFCISFFPKIVEELVDNAFKFSPNNGIVSITGKPDGTGNYLMEFSNEGEGLTEEQIHKIGAFIQFDRKKNEQQGSGLGLFIVKRMADVGGAAIEIQSEFKKDFKVILRFKTGT